MIDSGRTASDLLLEDLLDMDPAMLPPRMRGQQCLCLFSPQIYSSPFVRHSTVLIGNLHASVLVFAAKVKEIKKPNPIYRKESSKLGAYPPSDLEKPDKFLPKTQQFTKVVTVVLLSHSKFSSCSELLMWICSVILSPTLLQWHGGKFFANSTLNTSTDKSRVHRNLDQFGSL